MPQSGLTTDCHSDDDGVDSPATVEIVGPVGRSGLDLVWRWASDFMRSILASLLCGALVAYLAYPTGNPRLWNVPVYGDDRIVTLLGFASDNRLYGLLGCRPSIVRWDPRTRAVQRVSPAGSVLEILECDQDDVSHLDTILSHDGSVAAIGWRANPSYDLFSLFFRTNDGTEIARHPGGAPVAISPDNRFAVLWSVFKPEWTSWKSKRIRCVEIQTGRTVFEYDLKGKYNPFSPTGAAFAPDTTKVIVADYEAKTRKVVAMEFSLADGEETATYETPSPLPPLLQRPRWTPQGWTVCVAESPAENSPLSQHSEVSVSDDSRRRFLELDFPDLTSTVLKRQVAAEDWTVDMEDEFANAILSDSTKRPLPTQTGTIRRREKGSDSEISITTSPDGFVSPDGECYATIAGNSIEIWSLAKSPPPRSPSPPRAIGSGVIAGVAAWGVFTLAGRVWRRRRISSSAPADEPGPPVS